MYTTFYHLKEKPFNLTPASRFLYLGEIHKEALALLTYGVAERKGFVLLTGEVGTGKTTIVHALLKSLDQKVQCVFLSNPVLSPLDFLNYLAYEAMGREEHFDSKASFLIAFEAFLKKCLQQQRGFVLIIDEAHKLSFKLLEEIRLLSNMETSDEKLINIFLVGQPELNEKLSLPQCRPLLQRISIRYHLRPLDLNATRDYIKRRFKTAGAEEDGKIFSDEVIKAIHQYSEGYPRLVNVLADNVLLLGFSRGTKKITPAMVRESYEDMQLEGSLPKEKGPDQAPSPAPPIEKSRSSFTWKWVLLPLLAVVSILSLSPWGRDLLSGRFKVLSMGVKSPVNQVVLPPSIQAEQDKGRSRETHAIKKDDPIEFPLQKEELPTDAKENIPPVTQGIVETKAAVEENKESWKSVTVVQGDTLSGLGIRIYGRYEEEIMKFILQHNPQIKNVNTIEVGQTIAFPPLPEKGDQSSSGIEGLRD